jgi:hypothetical protein
MPYTCPLPIAAAHRPGRLLTPHRPRYRGPRRGGRFMRSVTVVPRPRAGSPAHRRQGAPAQGLSRRCARYRRPLPEPAASTRCRGPRPARAARHPQQQQRRRPVPDRVAAISLTAITKSSARAARRPACTAQRAVTRRTGRRSSARNLTPHDPARHGETRRSGPPSRLQLLPLPPGAPETSRPVPRLARGGDRAW